MSYISQIILTEYLWDNRASVERKCRNLGIPVDEDEVVVEWRDIMLNINLVAYCTVVLYKDSEEYTELTAVTLNTEGAPSMIINIDYNEFAHILSAAICDREPMQKSKIKLNEDNQE